MSKIFGNEIFENDLKNEKIISRWIYENGLSKLNLDYRREKSVNGQNSGVDLWIMCTEWFGDDEYHAIDEKSASNYIRINPEDSQLPTFAFELDYYSKKDRTRLEGWLFGKKSNATEFYMISWLWAGNYSDDSKKKKRDLDVNNIKYECLTKARIMLIKKDNLHTYLKNKKVNQKNFMRISDKIRNQVEENSVSIEKNNGYPKIVYSPYLQEKPVNVVIPIRDLEKMATKELIIDIQNGKRP